METVSVGIDIGGTKISSGLIKQSGEVLYKNIYATPKESHLEILKLLKDTILSCTKYAEENQLQLMGIGIGSAGQVSFKEGKIISGTANIKDWNNINVYDFLKEYTNLPIWLDNDVNTFAIAEYMLGSAKKTNNMICLTLGTGVGGGIISGGEIVRGEWGGAGELGHITVNMNGADCNCGSKGCIEVYSSGTGIANRMKEKISLLDLNAQDKNESLHFYIEHPEKLTSKEVFEWYDEGFPLAKEIIDLAVQALSYGLVSIIHTFNPSAIVLGGGLVSNRAWLVDAIKKSIQNSGIRSLIEPVEIIKSELGYDAGLIGAGSQAWFYEKGKLIK